MRLRVLTPTHAEVDEEVTKVSVQAVGGAFTMLPRHIDTVAVLETGLLTFDRPEGAEGVAAVDGGTVVKVGPDVVVSTPTAVVGADLASMRRAVEQLLSSREAHERAARRALSWLEVDVVERIVALEEEVAR